MSKILQREGIQSAVVGGYASFATFGDLARNVFMRNKAIQGFSKDIKVILLGLQNAASGTNLTQATHIVLMGEREVFSR